MLLPAYHTHTICVHLKPDTRQSSTAAVGVVLPCTVALICLPIELVVTDAATVAQ